MKNVWKYLLILLLILPLPLVLSGRKSEKKLRLLYWNIQMGMWDGQGDNYERFVDWVKSKDPDICVWCEGGSLVKTDSDQTIPKSERYLPGAWPELARRYGHEYVFVGGFRDPFPQVITSKYPIDSMGRFIGSEPDSVVVHGAGWAKVNYDGKEINVVSLHLQPYAYWRFLPPEKKEESRKNYGGEKYRQMEMKWILDHTLRTREHPDKELWIMAGDYNSYSRNDNYKYKWNNASLGFQAQDYMIFHSPFYDLYDRCYPDDFLPTCGSLRIDYMYVSKPMLNACIDINQKTDSYTERVYSGVSSFYIPSDHYPIIADFKISKLQ